MNVAELPDLSAAGEKAVLEGEDINCRQDIETFETLMGTKAKLHGQIADALTGILLHAAALSRNSTHSEVNPATVTSSCDHIAECAKRVWQLLSEKEFVSYSVGQSNSDSGTSQNAQI